MKNGKTKNEKTSSLKENKKNELNNCEVDTINSVEGDYKILVCEKDNNSEK